jgi:tRNA 2-thiouridine synthesizing protein A
MTYVITKSIDAIGAYCPGPLMELIRAIKTVEVGEVVELISSDKGSTAELPKWCEKAGHELLEVVNLDNNAQSFRIKKGEKKVRKK